MTLPTDMQRPPPYTGWGGSGIGSYAAPLIYGSWPNWAPPLLVPSFLTQFFCSSHFIKKIGVFLNARRFCYAKITFFPDGMSCTGSGKILKRKFMVLDQFWPIFPLQIKVIVTLICLGKKAETGPKTMNFRLRIFPEPVQLILSGKNVIFA